MTQINKTIVLAIVLAFLACFTAAAARRVVVLGETVPSDAAFSTAIAAAAGEEIEFSSIAIDRIISQFTDADILAIQSLSPEILVWMHGASDVAAGTDSDTYQAALARVIPRCGAAATVLVQPAGAGRAFASRALEHEYDAPSHAVEQAIFRYSIESAMPVMPSYILDYAADGRTLRPDAVVRLGTAVGAVIAAPEQARWSASVSADGPFSVTVTVANRAGVRPDAVDDLVAPAPWLGFEVWRTLGGQARRLNITSVTPVTGGYTIATNERLVAGDKVVYGCTDTGIGRFDGCRGNIAAGSAYLPVMEMDIAAVAEPEANITGTVTCDGAGVPGVTVSDGYTFATTDASGHYALTSAKRLGYVFYILPSGYEPVADGSKWKMRLHSLLTSEDAAVAEVHDFELQRADNTRHTMIVGADAHIAARNKDKSQFKSGFVASVKAFAKDATDRPVYSTILGDMSWDQYWYANNYALPDFAATLTDYGYPVKLFPVTGNHDNDGATPAGADCDFKAAIPFRRTMAPSYYSYNLGKIHYVVLDDIVYKNTYTAGKSYSTGIVGDRDYGRYFTSEQLEWLRHDLSLIADKSTPVVICFHIQNWALSTDGRFTVKANMDSGAAERLAEVVADFPTVHLLSGHTHYNFHAHPEQYPNIHENNVAGICATWWWTGKLTGRHICKDGSPGGYAVYEADGKNLTWSYRSVDEGDTPDTQCRIYDMNAVRAAYKSDPAILKWLAYDKTQTDYGTMADNMVYVNVFNYDIDWKVEVFEGDTPLEVTRITAQDPLHVITYDVPRYNDANTVTADFVTNRTNHMFRARAAAADTPVTVRLTDSFGRVYTRTIQRPAPFDLTLH